MVRWGSGASFYLIFAPSLPPLQNSEGEPRNEDDKYIGVYEKLRFSAEIAINLGKGMR